MNKTKRGFTLIELLVVISIISFLSSVVLVSLNSARLKARETRRSEDMHNIMVALSIFHNQYGCLPRTSGTTCSGATGYSDANAGGWDYSSQGGFMGFLTTSGVMPIVPVDPVNNMTGDGVPSGTYAYRYYCYPIGGAYTGLHLSYRSETTGSWVVVNNRLASNWVDNTFICQ